MYIYIYIYREREREREISLSIPKEDGKRRRVLLTPEASPAGNWAFDVTPRRLVTGLRIRDMCVYIYIYIYICM